jgi:shikimate kinase/3-dehydroquinate synthase
MQRIFLTGLPGAGKTFVGQRAASLLGWRFLDTDEVLMLRTGSSVEQILAQYGAERLSQFGSAVLHELVREERVVIAIGRNITMSEASSLFLRQHGLIAYVPEPPQANAKEETWNALAQRLVSQALVQGYLSVPHVAREIIQLHLEDAASQALIEWGGLPHLGSVLRELEFPERLFIVTDDRVGNLFAPSIRLSLEEAGFKPCMMTISAEEAHKSLECFKQLIDWLAEHRAERNEPILAVGGGVVGDIVGFVASSYRRGVPLVQVPTTLLAQVDSAIGGKTGINHPFGKNVIGSYYQPELIYVDPALMLVLPEREYGEGWAEIVKYAMILDADLFTLLEERLSALQARDPAQLSSIVARCIRIKMSVVQQDELDRGERHLLNYGHTFGHALETVTNYETWLHGEAVAIGMEVAAHIAVATGTLSQEEARRQTSLLQALHLPVRCPGVDVEALLQAMQQDKKVSAGSIRWVLPTCIGHAGIYDDIDPMAIQEAITQVCCSTPEKKVRFLASDPGNL